MRIYSVRICSANKTHSFYTAQQVYIYMSFSYLIIAVLLCSVPAMFVLTAVILVYVLVHMCIQLVLIVFLHNELLHAFIILTFDSTYRIAANISPSIYHV